VRGFVEPNINLRGVFGFICLFWLGGVGLRASPATYVGSCFYWEAKQALRALKLTTIGGCAWGYGTPYGFVCCFRVHLRIMVGRCWASCLTRNLRWILFLLGSPTSPSGIEINHHRRLFVGFVEPDMNLCGAFEFICTLWLGGVGLRASPATYCSCFCWEARQAHRALNLTTIGGFAWGVEPNINLRGVFEFICALMVGRCWGVEPGMRFVWCFRVHLHIMVGRCWASCLTRNLR